ncbi:LLM class flavin-dependent oxidoreductase [Paenibacillus sp. GCM10012307]|uniref:LLM class flavin-dependent oxidoreductase n=1 Tax=Paenibacillus roseus TaxID=2798579 RepID=A0A934JBE8_9BACL|nr:LLM class flavin-dependent oxidoreductase [Paenibacillus roseus]MBJ6363725.1 LLM class flavin-dependent oxidoreductase [Paenibacillus roseus]
MGLKLSILDQSPIFAGESAEEALRHSLQLAQLAEELGYNRFWVSEHHDTEHVAGSSPEVLLAYLLAHTKHIRLGSGGVMLQHYSPYKVAENFNVLAALAPGRIDLGVGRAPGGLPRSTRALQRGVAEAQDLLEKLKELQLILDHNLPEDHPLHGLRAAPLPAVPAPVFVLGTSVGSAEIAAELGYPYVFSQFINTDQEVARQAFTVYKERFNPVRSEAPTPILAVAVIVADTDEEAQELASHQKLVKIHLASGRTITVASIEHANEFGNQTNESFTIEEKVPELVKGSKETVRRKLLELQEQYEVEEIIVTTPIKIFDKRINSFKLLKEAFAEVAEKR